MVAVAIDVIVVIVVFIGYTHGQLFVQIEARFNSEKQLVFCENLFFCGVSIIDKGIEIGEAQVEKVYVHARLKKERVNTLAFVRM